MAFPQKLASLGSAAILAGALCAQAPVQRLPPPPPPSSSGDTPYPSPTPATGLLTPPAGAPLPPGAAEAFSDLSSQPATRSSFTLDRDMLNAMLGNQPIAIHSVTVTHYQFQAPAFYVPEALSALRAAFGSAGWKHLIEANVSRREEASPQKPLTDIWLHFQGSDIDNIAVLVRGPRQMDAVELSGMLRPLDLVHLSGRFGIPKVDPDAVMIPDPSGR